MDPTRPAHAEVWPSGQTRVLELMVQDAELADVLTALLELVERQSGSGLLTSILLLDPDGRHLRHGAAPSLPQAYNEAIDGLTVGPSAASCGTAAFLKQPVYVTHIATDPRWSDFRALAAEHGLRACWSIPILSRKGEVLGTFALYYREARDLAAEDERLIAFAIRTAAIAIERERAELALRESAERLGLALEIGRLGSFDYEPATGALIFSDTCRAQFGLAADAAVSLDLIVGMVHPDDREQMTGGVEAAFAGRGECESEYRIFRPDGNLHWIHARARVVEAAGKAPRLVGVKVNVTAQKRLELAQRRLLECSRGERSRFFPSLVCALAETLGVRAALVAEAVSGTPLRERVLALWDAGAPAEPFEYDVVGTVCQDVIAHGMQFVRSGVNERFPGSRWIAERGITAYMGTRLCASDGRVLGLLIAMHDRAIDETGRPEALLQLFAGHAEAELERVQREAALAESEARLRAMAESSPLGIFVMDASGDCTYVNATYQRISGLTMDEARGKGWSGAIHPDDRERVFGTWYETAGRGQPFESEHRFCPAGGETVWTRVNAAPILSGGALAGFVGTVEDITHRRHTEERLRQADRMEAVGQLAGGIAHEANNQMSVVLGCAEFLLSRDDLPEPVREEVEHMRKAAERTAGVTAQLLAFSRRQVLQPQTLDLVALVKGLAPILQRTLGEHAALVLELGGAPVAIKADPGRLEQVLLNLTLNARDAMAESPAEGRRHRLTIVAGAVELSAADVARMQGMRAPPGPYAALVVTDTGAGMEPETLSHAFEPFFTTKGVGHGSGLGLATVYGIVKQSGGYVSVCSEPGRGTTFAIYLPLTAEAAAPVPATAPAGPDHRGDVALVVEDDPLVRQIVRRALAERGYAVLEAADGEAALELLRKRGDGVHVVVTDVAMPGMSGRELAGRASSIAPAVPVLFMSGYADADMAERGWLDAGQPFLQKPFAPGELVRRVEELVTSRRSRAHTATIA
ncbi:MAG TPA: PAS domain S-box protein [Gemmatimonadales bacterium]|nr:PAS domain S-box protein [Gemmatimonadales bacterium]